MSISVNSFLVLEKSLTSKIVGAVMKSIAPDIVAFNRALKKDALEDARDIARSIDIAGVIEEQRKYVNTIGKTAVIFGAGRLVSAKHSTVVANPPTKEIEAGTNITIKGLLDTLPKAISSSLLKLVDERERALEKESEARVQKAERKLKELVSFSRQAAKRSALRGAAMISSLHTSRLSAWGYVMEAEALGVDTYAINEQLDNRICPVCRRMHGKTYRVEQAKSRLSSIFSVEDPADLKALAPWPSQTKSGLKYFAGLSDSDLVAHGWSMPPYHPGCRGLLVQSDKAPVLESIFTPKPAVADVAAHVSPLEYLPRVNVRPAEYHIAEDGSVTVGRYRLEASDVMMNEDSPQSSLVKGKAIGVNGTPTLEGLSVAEAIFNNNAIDEVADRLVSPLGASDIEVFKSIVSRKVRINSNFGSDGMLNRVFSIGPDGKIRVTHDLFRLPKDMQGLGIGKKVLRKGMELYRELGVAYVDLHANIDVGGYAWARYGFVPDAKSWKDIRDRVRLYLKRNTLPDDVKAVLEGVIERNDPKGVWDIADLRYEVGDIPLGRRLLLGSDWTGTLDLSDKEAMERFTAYVGGA